VLFQLQAGLDLFIDTLDLVNIDRRVNPDLPGLSLSTDDAAITFPLSCPYPKPQTGGEQKRIG
jgi:hypothetical protein